MFAHCLSRRLHAQFSVFGVFMNNFFKCSIHILSNVIWYKSHYEFVQFNLYVDSDRLSIYCIAFQLLGTGQCN